MQTLNKLPCVSSKMKRDCLGWWCISALSGLLFCSIAIAADSTTSSQHGIIDIDLAAFHHIQFDDIKPNKVTIGKQQIVFDVDSSASFVMQGLKQVTPVHAVSIHWLASGRPPLADARQEASKRGDDAVVKLALMIEGEPSGFGWFLPDWIKQVRSHLYHPSNEMIYLVADSRHAPGEAWENPYNEDISMIAMQNARSEDGAMVSSAGFDKPLRVVGIWLMADGDNTASSFRTMVTRVELNGAQSGLIQ